MNLIRVAQHMHQTRAVIILMTFTITIMAVSGGANAGLTATSASEAQVQMPIENATINESELGSQDRPENPAEKQLQPYERTLDNTVPDLPEPLRSHYRQSILAFANGLLVVGLKYGEIVANLTASFTYANQSWISKYWTELLLQVYGTLGIIGLSVRELHRALSRFGEQ